ncbi:MAG: gliding motility-associated C-terminal domain-containing protein [Saprospiraceae bacterium]
MKLFFLLVTTLFGSMLHGQEVLFRYTFDDCTYEDSNIKFPGMTPSGKPVCVCGMEVKSYLLNGTDDHITMTSQANIHLETDFTLDFYFWKEPNSGEMDIFSHRFGCTTLDSLMALRYFSDTEELLFEIGSSINNYHSIRKKLSNKNCWHRFTLVKFGLEYYVYFDNELAKIIISKETVFFSKRANLTFGNSPCNTINNATKYHGRLDEITMYKRALSEREIKNTFRYPDRIVTDNTTIFKGESITLLIGPTCADEITWSPAASLDNAKVIDPVATPLVSTTYHVTLTNAGCQSIDSVRIFIADKDKLDCDNLLLPKAFTPNNDGLNDRFGISNTFLVDAISYFEIYDRWGAKVWETNDLNDEWDGSFNNQPLNSGMYLYKISYTCGGENKLNINNVMLLR